MKFSDKETGIFRGISTIAGIFTLVVAFSMIFSLLQLKKLNPLDNPAIQSVKEQFDSNPDDASKAEQVRAMDLMARKAYFSSRWQVETGSYLLLAGAVVFILFQRLIAGSEKPGKAWRPDRPDIASERFRNRRYLLISGGAVTVFAVISSFILRSELPSPSHPASRREAKASGASMSDIRMPDGVNYPFFRGEGSRGIAGGKGYVTDWNVENGKNILWKSQVPLPGKSSPVIWGNNLYVTGAGEGQLVIFCFDKSSGKLLWTGSGSGFPGSSAEQPESDAEAGMAVPTAAADEKGVFAIFGNGNLVCYDHAGKLIWGINIGVPRTTYAFSSSLVIFNNILLVQYDTQDKISLLGFDTETGEKRWETPRAGRAVNSSPVLASFDGIPQLLINGNPNVSSFDPVTGTELWSLPGVSGDVTPSLAVNSKLVFATQDYFKLLALKPGKSGSTLWEDNTYTPDVASPVADERYLFVATGYGDVACYNAEKGDTLWTHYFNDTFYASPVICDEKVWLQGQSGTMHIAGAGPELEIFPSSTIGEKSDCTPAFSEKKIYIRGTNNLFCIGK